MPLLKFQPSYVRTLKTGVLPNSILRCFIVRLHDAKDICYYGSSALNYINSACMSGSFKLYLTSMSGCSGLHFSLLAECIIILLNHSWFIRSPLIRCKFFSSFVVTVVSFTDKETTYIYRVSQEERTKLREGVPYVKVYRYNPKHLYPKVNGYGDNGKRSLKL